GEASRGAGTGGCGVSCEMKEGAASCAAGCDVASREPGVGATAGSSDSSGRRACEATAVSRVADASGEATGGPGGVPRVGPGSAEIGARVTLSCAAGIGATVGPCAAGRRVIDSGAGVG